MKTIVILAYGSLIGDPGPEIVPLITRRVATRTPFGVEFARLSRSRGGAPTVVPHTAGSPVSAEILVLDEAVLLQESKNLLWRRETRNEGSGRAYTEKSGPDAVVIRVLQGFCDFDHTLYTDFNPDGKLKQPDPRALARAAVESVGTAKPGRDGISYLIALKKNGVETVLMSKYVAEILAIAGTTTLEDALEWRRTELSHGKQ